MNAMIMNNLMKEAIPEALRRCSTWLNWMTFDTRSGKAVSPYKSPITPRAKHPTSYNDPSNWLTLDDAIARANAEDGVYVGISLTDQGLKIDGGYLWCLDLDGFSADEGDDDGVLEFVERVGTYAEFSPSETGLKIYFTSDKWPTNTPKISFTPSKFATQYPAVKKYQERAIEVFSRARFLAVTGQRYLDKSPVLKHIREAELDSLLNELDQWAKKEGGQGMRIAASTNRRSAGTTDTSNAYGKLKEPSLEAVLARIAHHDEQVWSDVCHALARAYGESGRIYFLTWSEDGYRQGEYVGFNEGECNARYDRALRDVSGKTGYGCKHLCELAGLEAVNQEWEAQGAYDDTPLFDLRNTFTIPDYYSDHENQLALYDVDPEAITALSRFTFRTPSELASLPKMKWRVKNLLPATGIAAIFGVSGAGKSFYALDLLARVSLGLDFYAEKTKACSVVYVCLEGVGGISNRIAAWEKHHKQLLPNIFRVVTEQFSLFNQDAKSFALVIKNQGLDAGVIVIDTLNQSAPTADENTSADMGRIIQNAMTLQRLTSSLVILVHHSGKDTAKGLRGHSSLLAALDVAIEVKRTAAGLEWALSKAKDAANNLSRWFTLHQVKVGVDEDGEDISSCVAIPDQNRIFKRPPPKGKNQVLALYTIRTHLDQTGAACISGLDAKSIVVEALGDIKQVATRAKEAIVGLIGGGYIEQDGDTLILK